MLYLKEKVQDSTLLGVWRIDESRDELLALLDRHDWLEGILAIKSEIRMLEMLAVRVLLKEMVGEETEISYLSSGKPYLANNSYHVSISHTKKYVGVAINKEHPVGLDVEQISEKIKRVQSRVVSADEYIDTNNEVIHLLLHWSAKEAMFKYLNVEGVDFLKHLFVERFIPAKEGTFKASECRTKEGLRFDAYYKITSDFVLACLIESNMEGML